MAHLDATSLKAGVYQHHCLTETLLSFVCNAFLPVKVGSKILHNKASLVEKVLCTTAALKLCSNVNLPQSKEAKPIQSSAACVSVPWWLPNSHDRNQKCLLENLPVERSILIQFSQCLVTWCYATELSINVQSALRYCRHEVSNGCMFSSGFVFFTLLWTWRFSRWFVCFSRIKELAESCSLKINHDMRREKSFLKETVKRKSSVAKYAEPETAKSPQRLQPSYSVFTAFIYWTSKSKIWFEAKKPKFASTGVFFLDWRSQQPWKIHQVYTYKILRGCMDMTVGGVKTH